MQLSQIFKKPVDRPIEGVIKADDESGLVTEIEEYVLTNEVAKRLEAFLEAYNNYQGSNGAWVSGFFGSGKSHLLKMLALILENRVIDQQSALERFLPKCEGNALLKANLQKAAAIPSRSILFNIDQKADIISKTQADALLAVFVKVFDEMCGYYGKQGYIANFERDLDGRDLYPAFKTAFQRLAGLPWEAGREQALIEADNIAAAYAQTTQSSPEAARGILDKYRAEYKVSIEDFAIKVNDYIERQGKTFRLNFLVDEVGQYIAENVKLMTNLQTIAESLATKSRGRAWIIVTAQEEMESVIGEVSNKQANDFSKIMARFSTRLKLTSQNVSEVIQKRLLTKAEAGLPSLEALYRREQNNFGTLFDFADGSRTYKQYRDQQHFIDSYPFVPYQFELFQLALQGLSQHNAFEGKHRSVGERSMLEVFQLVAIKISNHELGQLATFDLMFEGIRNTLKAQNQQAILTAERNLGHPFAVRVLKALFLVKYLKEFKPTLHNITVLMTEQFGGDTLKLRQVVEEALSRLEQQTYIQRNGELYEYLTNEEKDVEEEIKNTEVDTDGVSAELAKIIFDQIIRDRKIRYDHPVQDFSFSRKLDEELQSKEFEMALHVISPFHENFDDEKTLLMHAMGRDELLVILPPDSRLMQDLLMYKRTEKYISQNISVTQQDGIRRILMDKNHQNQERQRQIATRLKELLTQAKLFLGGTALEIVSTDPQTRMMRGFYELIKLTYPNLTMLHGVNYAESDIENCLRPAAGTLIGVETALNEAGREMLAFIQSNRGSGVRTTLKSLDDRFERKPYGWSLAAVQCNVALLAAQGKVELRADSNLLEDSALARSLRNTQGMAGVMIEPQVEYTAGQTRRLKEFYEEFFDKPARATEAHDLGKETNTALQSRVETLKQLVDNWALYPFVSELKMPLTRLQELLGKPYDFYLTELPKQMKELLDMKEQTIAPIISFMGGGQKTLYDEARQFYQTQAPNFDYLAGAEAGELREVLAEPQVFKSHHMTRLRALMTTLKIQLTRQLQQEKDEATQQVNAHRTRLEAMPEFARLTTPQQTDLVGGFERFIAQLAEQGLIAKVRDSLRVFLERTYPQQLLSQMTSLTYTPPPEGGDTKVRPQVAEPKVEYVSSHSIRVAFEKAWLADEADVDAYLSALRAALMEEIGAGKRIQI